MRLEEAVGETGAILYQSKKYMITSVGNGLAITLFALHDAERLTGKDQTRGAFVLSSVFLQGDDAGDFIRDLESAQAHKKSNKIIDHWLSGYDWVMEAQYVGACRPSRPSIR